MDEQPARMLGVDYGERRIGLAVSDGTVAVPLRIVEHRTRSEDLDAVAAAARDEGACAVVVGLPLLPSGDEGEQSRRTRRFAEGLARRLEIPVLYHDELLSTAKAASALRETGGRRRRARVDDRAAAVILQSYIDEHHPARSRAS